MLKMMKIERRKEKKNQLNFAPLFCNPVKLPYFFLESILTPCVHLKVYKGVMCQLNKLKLVNLYVCSQIQR
jgi:hypothetical protein